MFICHIVTLHKIQIMKKLLSVLVLLNWMYVSAQDLGVPDMPDTEQALSDDEKSKLSESVDGWKIGGSGSLTFNQVGLKNWSAGGDPSIALLGVVNGYADLKRGKHLLQNRLGVEYGIQKIKGESVRKNSDRLELFSKYGYEVAPKWYAAAYANIRTVMTPTYEYDSDGNKVQKISRFASPMYIEGALGMDYVPNEHLSLFLSPAAAKMTIVKDKAIRQQDRYGTDGEKFRWELGATAILAYKQEIVKNVNMQTVLKVYKDYRNGPAQNIDVDWQTTLGFKVNKFLSAAVFTHLIWDYDQLLPQFDKKGNPKLDADGIQKTARKVQFRDVIGIGLAYSMDKTIERKQPVEM